MSSKVQSFFQKVSEDAALRGKVEDIRQSSVEAAAEAISALARESGFDLTAEDFLANKNEISEADLADVAGGVAGDTGIMGQRPGPQWKWTEQSNGYLKWEKLPGQK